MTENIRTEALCKRFGGIVVADRIDLSLKAGQIVGLIGPNGAGKTSLFNLIAGVIPADSGAVLLNGAAIDALPMHAHARAPRAVAHLAALPTVSLPERARQSADRAPSLPWRVAARCVRRDAAHARIERRDRAAGDGAHGEGGSSSAE